MKVWHRYMSVSVIAAALLLPGVVRGADKAQIAFYPGEASAMSVADDSRICGPDTMTQSTSPTLLVAGSVSCPGPSGTTKAASWARCFSVSSSTYPFGITVNCVRFGVQQASVATTVTVKIYADTNGCPPTSATLVLLGTMNISIPAGTALQMFTADFTSQGGVFVAAGTPMVVEVAAPDLSGVGTFLIGANHDGESASGYIKSSACSLPDFVTLASVGYPTVHLAYSVDYYEGGVPPVGACCYPNGECWYGLQAECAAGGGAFQRRLHPVRRLHD